MAEQSPAIPPSIPPKPFKISQWLVGVFALFVVAYVAISLIRLPDTSKEKRSAQLPAAVAGQSDVDSFQQMRDEKFRGLARKRALMLAELQKAGLKDEAALLEIVNQLPPCDNAERQKLNGQNYVAVNQQSKQVVQFSCGLDDTWHPLPQEASAIEPPTPEQQRAMRRMGNRQSGNEASAKEKAAQALDAALQSSSVVDYITPPGVSGARAVPVSDGKPVEVARRGEPADDSREGKHGYEWDTFTGPLYRVFEGDVIEGILTNRLAGEFTGPVNVMVTTNLYSRDRQHILMPQGTRVLGEAAKVGLSGQQRLAVPFHRAIMPDGYSVDIDKFAGLDQQGATGLTGRVNTHWPRVIATAVLVGAIGGLAQAGGIGGSYNGVDAIRLGVTEQAGQSAMQILNRALNVLPTITVYEGTRVRIWVQRDFQLPAYENHTVSPTL